MSAASTSTFPHVGSARGRVGRPIDGFDAQIAAIARSRGADLATRNVNDFTDTGLHVIDPWTSSASVMR